MCVCSLNWSANWKKRRVTRKVYIPFAERDVEKSFENKLSGLAGKKLTRQLHKKEHRDAYNAMQASLDSTAELGSS